LDFLLAIPVPGAMPANPFSDQAGNMAGLLFFGTDEFIITPSFIKITDWSIYFLKMD